MHGLGCLGVVIMCACWKGSKVCPLPPLPQVLYPDTKLCKILNYTHAYGLPHVLRVVSKDGEQAIAYKRKGYLHNWAKQLLHQMQPTGSAFLIC